MPGVIYESGHSAYVCSDPEAALTVFGDRIDERVYQTVAHAVVRELVTIKPAQPFPGGEPHVALLVLVYVHYAAVGQPVRHVVVADGKLLGGRSEGADYQGEKALRRDNDRVYLCQIMSIL